MNDFCIHCSCAIFAVKLHWLYNHFLSFFSSTVTDFIYISLFFDNKLVLGWLLHFVHQFQWSLIQVDSSFMWPVDNSPLSFIYDIIPGIFTSFGPNSIMMLFIQNISSGTIYLEWPWICHIRIEIIHWVIFRHSIPHLPWQMGNTLANTMADGEYHV